MNRSGSGILGSDFDPEVNDVLAMAVSIARFTQGPTQARVAVPRFRGASPRRSTATPRTSSFASGAARSDATGERRAAGADARRLRAHLGRRARRERALRGLVELPGISAVGISVASNGCLA